MKKLYGQHRVFIILMAVVLVCFVIIISLLLRYFYFGTGPGPTRTCSDISTARQNEIISILEDDELITSATMRISDRSNVMFISITFEEEASLVEAQSKAIGILEEFSDEEKQCYDFQFFITKPDGENHAGFHLMGARNTSGTNVLWNNNREVEDDEEDTE